MNVLLIGSELGKGGAERSISLLSYYLEKTHTVTLCILSVSSREQFYKTCKNVIFLDPPPATSLRGKIGAWRYRLRKIRELKKDLNIDVSISFLEGPDYVNVLTKGKEKVVLSIRGSKQFDSQISGLKGSLRKKLLIPQLYNRADLIVPVTKALAQELTTYFNVPPRKLMEIYNFYEADVIKKQAAEPLSPAEQQIFSKDVVITSGRLHPGKAQLTLLHVIQKLREKSDTRLIILGDGDLKNTLLEEANSLGLTTCDWQTEGFKEADVYLMGFQANAFKFYNRSKVFILSSSYEGFPNVLAEALLCEMPVVSTDCPTGPREILDIENGLPDHPVTVPVRVDTGSLMPLLDKVTDTNIDYWAQELQHWLVCPAPMPQDYHKLTNRFTLPDVLKRWDKVITEPVK